MASTNLPNFDPNTTEPFVEPEHVRALQPPDITNPPEQYPMYISCGPRPPTPPPRIPWHLFAPHKKQQYHLPPNIHDPRMYYPRRWGAFAKLLNKQNQTVRDELFFADAGGRSTLEVLPTELLDIILENLRSDEELPWSIFVLVLTSKTMWNRVLQHFLESQKCYIGCWANTPLICAAETMEDFPPAKGFVEGEADAKEWFARAENGFLDLNDDNLEWLHYYQGLLWKDSEEWKDADDVDKEKFERVFGPVPKVLKPKIEGILKEVLEPRRCGDWVLRNLTERKFVRLSMVEGEEWLEFDLKWFTNVAAEKWMSLDAMLLKKICWSGRHEDGTGPKGEWAGHCFDIVEGETFDEEGWEDVTESVAV